MKVPTVPTYIDRIGHNSNQLILKVIFFREILFFIRILKLFLLKYYKLWAYNIIRKYILRIRALKVLSIFITNHTLVDWVTEKSNYFYL